MARRKTNEFEDLVDALADSLVDAVESFPVAAAPFGQTPLSRDEQVERYREMRDNPEAWSGMIRERGHREVLRYARTMERTMRRSMEANNARTIANAYGIPGRPDRDELPGSPVDRQPI